MSKPSVQKPKQYNWLLVIAIIALAVVPLIFVRGEYKGSDDQGEDAIKELNSAYKPWFKPFFEPASGEIESLLFSSQAALGAGVIGYVIGMYKGRSQKQSESPPDQQLLDSQDLQSNTSHHQSPE